MDGIYVIDVMQGSLVTTKKDISTTKILSVQNYAKMAEERKREELIQAAIADAKLNVQTQAGDEESSEEAPVNVAAGAQADMAAQSDIEDDNDIDIVGIIGLIVGACALIVGTMNVFVMSSMKAQITANKDDLVSLGSKDVA